MKISAVNISKKYNDRVGFSIHLLNNISFDISNNQFITFLAPVGSGKSSLLKIISGIDEPSTGKIDTDLETKILIPTKPSSFPWLSVEENIRFNSKLGREKVSEIIDLVGLHGYEDHYPNTKSEGFRFRISLGRALANQPDIIIMDEPFNNLNTSTRQEIYTLIRKIKVSGNFTFILGTTNITEAIFLSDKIFLMKRNPGEIIETINVDLPSERSIDMLLEVEFIQIRTEIENVYKNRLDRQLYNFSI